MKRIQPKSCNTFKIDKIEYDENSHLILGVFPPVFFSKITHIAATSDSSSVMLTQLFP